MLNPVVDLTLVTQTQAVFIALTLVHILAIENVYYLSNINTQYKYCL